MTRQLTVTRNTHEEAPTLNSQWRVVEILRIGDKLQIVLQSLDEIATEPPPLGVSVAESVRSKDKFG